MATSNIAQFYEGRSVFITGATGFMGKVLLEKLMRSCPGIDRFYLLMRCSKGKTLAVRLQELANNEVFDGLRQGQPNFLSKMIAVEGDVTVPGLGLSPSDLRLLEDNVSVVFNLAATVRFDEELKDAVELNVNGPMRLLKVCRNMSRLKALVHVSTAFNNLHRHTIDEVVYPGTLDPKVLIDFINGVDDREFINSITKQLIGECPNTYTFTKGLAEQIIEKERGTLPLVIVRPSIVTASLKEPYPGWIDNLNGPSGLLAGGGKGFIRIFKRRKEDLVTDLIPVDFSINLMIAAAWEASKTEMSSKRSLPIYTSSTSQHNPITFGQFQKYSHIAWERHPTSEMLWYPSSACTGSDWYYKFNVIMFHLFPAYLVDFFFRILAGKKPKWARLYQRAFRALSGFDYFFGRHWLFISHNPTVLWSKLSARDREIFYFDVKSIDWPSYFEIYVLGVRKFLLKDDPSTLSTARWNLKKLYLIRTSLRLIFYVLLFVGSRTLLFK